MSYFDLKQEGVVYLHQQSERHAIRSRPCILKIIYRLPDCIRYSVLNREVLSLPMFPELDQKEIEFIADIINKAS